jgi:hypothetical protein
VDTIATDFVFSERETVLSVYPHGLHNVDVEGRPVLVYRFGAVDLEALNKTTTQQRLTQFHIQVRAMHVCACLTHAGSSSVLSPQPFEFVAASNDMDSCSIWTGMQVLHSSSPHK